MVLWYCGTGGNKEIFTEVTPHSFGNKVGAKFEPGCCEKSAV